MVWPAIIGAVGSIASGLIGSAGSRAQNAAQIQAAEDQMDFQRNMSNTAYQRGMRDMKKAGLNPILAGRLGGASSPAGAQPNIVNEQSALASGIDGATTAFMQNQQISAQNAQIRAQTRQTDAQTALIREQTEIANKEAQKAQTFAPGWEIIREVVEELAPPVREFVLDLVGSNAKTPPGTNPIPEDSPNSANKQHRTTTEAIKRRLNQMKYLADEYRKLPEWQKRVYESMHGKPKGIK